MKQAVTDYFLYRWRYFLGYGAIAVGLILLLWLAGTIAPGGITEGEKTASVISQSIDWREFPPSHVIDLPYHLLQRASFELFGVTNLSIKLPSLLLAFATTVGLIILLSMWFRRNVAVITSVIVVTTGHFLFVAQSGTPHIAYVASAVWLLLFAMLISRKTRLGLIWKIAMGVTIGLSLYTPLSIYVLAALFLAAAIHPHLRYLIRRMTPWKVIAGAAVGLLIITPLIIGVVRDPSVIWALLGIPTSGFSIVDNLVSLYERYLNFAAPTTGVIMAPVYGLASVLLILLGIYRLFTAKHTARNYIISTWSLLLVPILLLNPNIVSVTFVPFMLLIGLGIEQLIRSWYGMFPLNPYARVAGLLPLSFLLAGMVMTGYERYVYGHLHGEHVSRVFSHDLRLLHTEIDRADSQLWLATSDDERPFYEAVAHYHPSLQIVGDSQSQPDNATLLYTHALQHETPPEQVPARIITNRSSTEADRLYLYRPSE